MNFCLQPGHVDQQLSHSQPSLRGHLEAVLWCVQYINPHHFLIPSRNSSGGYGRLFCCTPSLLQVWRVKAFPMLDDNNSHLVAITIVSVHTKADLGVSNMMLTVLGASSPLWSRALRPS